MGWCSFRLRQRFQSTRPRGARQVANRKVIDTPGVSIHAPAWGATRRVCGGGLRMRVSIHAPAWGATRRRLGHSRDLDSFNPRARVGRDVNAKDLKALHTGDVSIHAPAWGATFSSRLSVSSRARFQSTRPRGARLAMDSRDRGHQMFQSTRPRGARPRPMPALPVFCGVSIHAPAWGATPCQFGESPILAGFNPRARVGRDVV